MRSVQMAIKYEHVGSVRNDVFDQVRTYGAANLVQENILDVVLVPLRGIINLSYSTWIHDELHKTDIG